MDVSGAAGCYLYWRAGGIRADVRRAGLWPDVVWRCRGRHVRASGRRNRRIAYSGRAAVVRLYGRDAATVRDRRGVV